MALEYTLNIKDNGSAAIKNINSNLTVLQKNITQVNKSVNVFQSSMSKAGSALSGFGSIMLGKGFDALKNFAGEIIQTYDSAAKLSSNIGITAESVLGLRHAAELSGVGASALDANIVKLSKSISEAAAGSGRASAAFAKMGIDVKNADGSIKNSEQVLMEMADAFKEFPAGADAATLAMDVFGESGASMVSMLKDGSSGLRKMVDEGIAAAGNVESVAAAMESLNDAGTRAKAVLIGMIATLADTAPFKAAISWVSNLSKEWAQFAADRKEMANMKERDAERIKSEAVANVKLLEQEKAKIMYSKKNQEEKNKEIAQIARELAAAQKKSELNNEELFFYEACAQARVLEQKAKEESLSGNEQGVLESYKKQIDIIAAKTKTQEEAAAAAAKAAEQERIDAAKAIAGHREKQKAIEEAGRAAKKATEEAARAEAERIKEEARVFNEEMKNREAATKNLADFDEKASIAALDGEKQKLAQLDLNYQKQVEELNRLHNAQSKYAEDEEKLAEEQLDRLIKLEQRHYEQKEALKEVAAKSLEDFDKNAKIAALDGDAQKLAQLDLTYQKQMENLVRLHEAQLAYAEDEEEFAQEHADRLLALEEQHLTQKDALRQELAAAEMERQLSAVSANFSAMQQLTAGYKSFAVAYKASAMGEAAINAVQSVLKTMSSVPYPFNIPLATMQAAAAAVQVSKIASTKMYAGGIIKGRNRLIMANEEGEEAILNTRAVRAVGGAAGVNALNSGIYNNSSYSYDNRRSSSTIVINSALMSPKILSEEIMPALERQNRRR